MRAISVFIITTVWAFGAFNSQAEGHAAIVPFNKHERAVELTNRVEEIKQMDFSTLEKEGKKELREELKEIKKELKGLKLDDKLTISVGAAIIIVLLLIIIF